MENQLRELIGAELRRRHGYGMVEGKIKPVQIANALMRWEYQGVGRTVELKSLLTATASKESLETRIEAVKVMLERNRDRWGRLGEVDDIRRSTLMTRVLPLLRQILATDGAALGKSIEFSSFSSPTAMTVTRDISDDHAGEFIHTLWGSHDAAVRLDILDILKEVTDPAKPLTEVDDLSAVLAPLAEEMVSVREVAWAAEDLGSRPLSPVEIRLRDAAADLARYERALRPNPISSLQRVVLLAAISLFVHGATRSHEWSVAPRRLLLVDASATRTSAVAMTSERMVHRILEDSRFYMADILRGMFDGANINWDRDPEATLRTVFEDRLKKASPPRDLRPLYEALDDIRDGAAVIREELPKRLVELLDSASGRSLDGFLRLLGLRCGLLYPQQKNMAKRVQPMDRTLEVLVAGTLDVASERLEYRDFLDRFHDRWGMLVGGRPEDHGILAAAGHYVPNKELTENSERFLARLQALGLARRMADSVAVVGRVEG